MSSSLDRLQPDKPLSIFEIAGSTIAQIAPAFSFYFGFAVIASAAGIGAPFTILVSAVAIVIVGLGLAHFARVRPSSGSIVTFLGITFGGVVGTTSAVVFAGAYVVLLASVALVVGGWVSLSLQLFYGLSVPWVPLTIVFVLIAWLLTISGIDRSTRVATGAMIVEVGLLVLVSLLVLFHPPSALSLRPFSPTAITGGLSGLGQAFPLAVFLFIGFENSIALAEEAQLPKRNIPRAVLSSIGLMGVLYLLVSYATIEGFGGNITQLAGSQIPFITLAQKYLGGFAVLAALAGFTSAAGTLLAGANNLSRVLFDSARNGLFPRPLAFVSRRFGTPVVALTIPTILGLILALIVAQFSGGWVNGFAYLSTLGSIPLIVLYAATNLAVIFYAWPALSILNRYVLPIIGIVTLAVPLWALVQPGQAAPYSWFPLITLALLVVSLIYAFWKARLDPQLPARIGAAVSSAEVSAPDSSAGETVAAVEEP